MSERVYLKRLDELSRKDVLPNKEEMVECLKGLIKEERECFDKLTSPENHLSYIHGFNVGYALGSIHRYELFLELFQK